MFDVGFSEMLVIGIVALVVIGPERLPGVARTIGHLMGRAQRYVNDVKRDIDREMQVEELRKLQEQMQETARNIESSVTTQVGEVKSELDKAQDTMNQFAQQSADLTRLDDPLVAESASATPATQAVASSAGSPSSAGVADSLTESGADADVTVVASPPDAHSSNVAGPSTGLVNAPDIGSDPSVASVSASVPANASSEIAEGAAEETVQDASDDGVERLRHEVDHIVPDYSEGIMGPNTSIRPDPVQPASGGSGSAGGVAGVSRTVLVHVDVPPVT